MIKDIYMTRSTKQEGFNIATKSNHDLKRNKDTPNIIPSLDSYIIPWL